MTEPRYPFSPKSNRLLKPGQFYPVRVRAGLYGCGRVLQVEPGSRTAFLAGLLGWCGSKPPNSQDIAGARVLEAGGSSVHSLHFLKARILGHRPLELDGIEVPLFLDATTATQVQRGYTFQRRPTPRDREVLPVLTVWGMEVIRLLAATWCKEGPKAWSAMMRRRARNERRHREWMKEMIRRAQGRAAKRLKPE